MDTTLQTKPTTSAVDAENKKIDSQAEEKQPKAKLLKAKSDKPVARTTIPARQKSRLAANKVAAPREDGAKIKNKLTDNNSYHKEPTINMVALSVDTMQKLLRNNWEYTQFLITNNLEVFQTVSTAFNPFNFWKTYNPFAEMSKLFQGVAPFNEAQRMMP